MIPVTGSIALQDWELHERFIRASGPGGQNVNQVASAVQLRFDVRASPSLPEAVKRRALALAGARATKEGAIVITARAHRTQERNRAEARARLVALLRRAAVPPRPRKATRIPAGAKRARLTAKKRRSEVKRGRGRVSGEE
ncbi:MAG: aminoacyl-tRNA hydrolase [Caulobacterales bacterium]|nr:aminoacyl-tRNA hydrolase [Caulobacterales bacterium]